MIWNKWPLVDGVRCAAGADGDGGFYTRRLTIFVAPRKWFNRLEIEAFKSPGQPGWEGDNDERNRIEALPVLRW